MERIAGLLCHLGGLQQILIRTCYFTPMGLEHCDIGVERQWISKRKDFERGRIAMHRTFSSRTTAALGRARLAAWMGGVIKCC